MLEGALIIMGNLLVILAVGFTFGFIFYKMKVPGGMMIGSLISVATFNIFCGIAYIPQSVKYISQIIAGAYIGCLVEKSDIKRFKYIIKPALLILTNYLFLNILLGFLIYHISDLDLITSMMGSIPGGMTDIPIISADMGADTPGVTVLQFIRMVICVSLFPGIISKVSHNDDKENNNVKINKIVSISKGSISNKRDMIAFIQTMAVAAIIGMLGKVLKVPAGVLTFSIIGVMCFKLALNRATCMTRWAKMIAQALSGIYIGSGINYNDVLKLKGLIIPVILIVLCYLGNCFITGRVLSKYFGMSTKEGMLSTIPAGAADMALIASDIGVESTDIAILQIIRLIAVIALFPQIINIIVNIAT